MLAIIKVGMEDTNHNIINTALVVLLHHIILMAGQWQTDGSHQQDLINMVLQQVRANINNDITLIIKVINLKIHQLLALLKHQLNKKSFRKQ